MERFRVISDLHLDMNLDYPMSFKKDGVFTVIAGDTCGSSHIVEHKNSNKFRVEVRKFGKLLDFVGKKSGKFEFTYSSSEKHWKYGDKDVKPKELDIVIEPIFTTELNDSDKIEFNVKSIEKWIRRSVSSGIIVAGNHLVYNREGKPIEELKEDLGKTFPHYGNITFLDDSIGVMSKEVDGIVFIGSTLYTDYEYVGENTSRYGKPKSVKDAIDMNMRLASPRMSGGGLNDFNYGRTIEGTYKKSEFDDDDRIYWLTPKNCRQFFERTMERMERIVANHTDKPIVVVTHHCPSPKCISSEYIGSELNASYVSDLEDFIRKYPNIRCWCCGHVHHRDDFMVGDACRVVMNPLGYCKYGHFKKGIESSTDWSFNTFVNTKTWEVEREPFDISKMNKRYEADRKRREALYKKFGGMLFW